MHLIHPKQMTTPLFIVKRYVDAGRSVSDALARSIEIIDYVCAENPGEEVPKVLALAEELAVIQTEK